MKVKRKGNVYPFLSSPPPPPPQLSSSSSSSSYKDPDSVLKLLPVAISALALSLPNEDQEVLAYLIARSIIATATNPYSSLKNKCRTPNPSNGKNKKVQKVPPFQCGCFDCYTSFWYRWDSSPNRELIHQVIEAFEDHLLQNESPRKHNRGKIKKRDNKVISPSIDSDILVNKPETEPKISVAEDECDVVTMPENTAGGGDGDIAENEVVCEEEKMGHQVTENLELAVVTVHKGLARKVLPDVVGLLNSRLWSLWSPGI